MGNKFDLSRTLAYTTPHDPPRRQMWRDGALVGRPMILRFVLRYTQFAISINAWRNS